jgi:hypothetical protein
MSIQQNGDDIGMESEDQIVASIVGAIRSEADVYVFDQVIEGPDKLQKARKLLIDRRQAVQDPEEAAFLTRIIEQLGTR